MEVPTDSSRPFLWAAREIDDLNAGAHLLSDCSRHVLPDCLMKLTAAAVPCHSSQQASLTLAKPCNLYQPDMLDRPAKFYMKGSKQTECHETLKLH